LPLLSEVSRCKGAIILIESIHESEQLSYDLVERWGDCLVKIELRQHLNKVPPVFPGPAISLPLEWIGKTKAILVPPCPDRNPRKCPWDMPASTAGGHPPPG
jgi:hypothetical protein